MNKGPGVGVARGFEAWGRRLSEGKVWKAAVSACHFHFRSGPVTHGAEGTGHNPHEHEVEIVLEVGGARQQG